MAALGPKANMTITTRKGGSPLHLLRVLKFARPYYRYLIPGLICIVIFAMTYSLNIAALLPTVKLIADDQGLPAWVNQYVAEKRLGFLLAPGEGGLRVFSTSSRQPLPDEIQPQDIIKSINGRALAEREAWREVAHLPDDAPVRLELFHPKSGRTYQATIEAAPISLPNYWLREIAEKFPQGTTRDDRMKTLYILLAVVLTITLIGGISRFFGEYLIALVAGML